MVVSPRAVGWAGEQRQCSRPHGVRIGVARTGTSSTLKHVMPSGSQRYTHDERGGKVDGDLRQRERRSRQLVFTLKPNATRNRAASHLSRTFCERDPTSRSPFAPMGSSKGPRAECCQGSSTGSRHAALRILRREYCHGLRVVDLIRGLFHGVHRHFRGCRARCPTSAHGDHSCFAMNGSNAPRYYARRRLSQVLLQGELRLRRLLEVSCKCPFIPWT